MKIKTQSKGFTFLIALFFAVIFWAFVMADSNTVRVTQVKNIDIQYTGIQELNEKGLIVTNQLRSTCNIKVEGKVNTVSYLNNSNFTASVDLSKIESKGEYELEINIFSINGAVAIKSSSPNMVKIVVDDYEEKDIPLEVEFDKEIPNDIYVSYPTFSKEILNIQGGKEEIASIVKGIVKVDVDNIIDQVTNGHSGKYSLSLQVQAVDIKGETIKEVGSIIVSMDIMHQKTVSVKTTIVGTNNKSFVVIPQVKEISIAGSQEKLDSINEISLEEIDISGKTESFEISVKPLGIDDIIIIDDQPIIVKVEME